MIESITLLNRHIANEQVDKQKRYQQILEILGDKEMTAKEIAQVMYEKGYTPTNERNFSSPRITEMLINGRLEVVGKKKCEWTGKSVSVFKRRNENV